MFYPLYLCHLTILQWLIFFQKKITCSFGFITQVLYWTDNSKESMIGKSRVSGNVTTKNITGLRANTIYFASVRAYNTAGTGPSSPPVNVTTKKSRKYICTYL